MKPGDLVVCRNGARLRVHHAGAAEDRVATKPYWASEIEVDELATVLDWHVFEGQTDLYVMGPRGCGWIWEDSVQIVRTNT